MTHCHFVVNYKVRKSVLRYICKYISYYLNRINENERKHRKLIENSLQVSTNR